LQSAERISDFDFLMGAAGATVRSRMERIVVAGDFVTLKGRLAAIGNA
jgi:hypothetical protein